MSYKLVETEDRYAIQETDTGEIIHMQGRREYLNSVIRKLNLGSGFKGYTPNFFANFIPEQRDYK